MQSQRISGTGQAELEAGDTVNTLRIGAVVSYRPLRHDCICGRCGSKSTQSGADLRSGVARCMASGCGRNKVREELEQTPAKHRRQLAEAEEAARRKALAIEAAKLAELEATYKKSADSVAHAVRDGILRGQDAECHEDPATQGKTMTQTDARAFNIEQCAIYCWRHPKFPATSSNLRIVGDYLERNGVSAIVSATTIERAVQRLTEFGLLEYPPPPTPQPTADYAAPVIEPEPKLGPVIHVGVDPRTGRDMELTDREVERLTSDQFRQVFQLSKPDRTTALAWGRP